MRTRMHCKFCLRTTETEVLDEFPAPSPATYTIVRYCCSECKAVMGTEHRHVAPLDVQRGNVSKRENY